jgi:hypothetical protein
MWMKRMFPRIQKKAAKNGKAAPGEPLRGFRLT